MSVGCCWQPEEPPLSLPGSPALGDVLQNHAPSCPSQQPVVQPNRRPGTVLELNLYFHPFYPNFGEVGITESRDIQLTPCACLPGGTRALKCLYALSRGSKTHLWGWNDFINHSGFFSASASLPTAYLAIPHLAIFYF